MQENDIIGVLLEEKEYEKSKYKKLSKDCRV